MKSLSKAQLSFLRMHMPSGYLFKHAAHKTYDFVGRMRDAGLVEIDKGSKIGWPWSWDGTRLTDKGREAAEYQGKHTVPMVRVVTEDDIDIREPKP